LAEPSSREGDDVLEALRANRTGLLIFDIYEAARATIEERGMSLDPLLRLVAACRDHHVPIFYTRPIHRADGRDFARTVADMDREHRRYDDAYPPPKGPGVATAGSPLSYPLAELGIGPTDYEITKHRWSAFHETPLDLELRSADVEHLLIVGGTTHIGVASSVYSARDRDYQVTVVRDCCHGPARELASLLDDIFPQICHVATVDEVLAHLVD
jgi:nicotinamidase-related amidase